MRGVKGPFLLRRMASAWLLLGAFMVTVLIAAALLAALASFNSQVLPQVARRQLTAASGQTGIVVTGPVDAAIAAADQPAVRAALAAAFGPVPYHLDGAIWSNPLGLPRAAGSRVIRLAQAAAPAQVRQHATLLSGAWPGPPQPGQPVPTAVPEVAASQLGLKPGDEIAVRDRDDGRRSTLRVTGVFALRDPSSTYWGLDIVDTSGISIAPGFTTYGPFVVSPAVFSARPGQLTVGQASWAAALEAARIQAGQIGSLGARITRESAFLQNTNRLGGLQVSSALPALLVGLNRSLAVARSLLVISALQLLLLAAAALVLVSRLLTSHRTAENALLSSRGATGWQLAGITLTETLVLAAVAAAAGAVAGARLAALLGRAGALRADRLALSGFPASVWLAVALMLVLCLVIAVWPALRAATPGAVAVRRGRQAAVAGIVRSGADVALVVLALIAVRELRSYSSVARLPTGGLGLDPVLTAAPALALAAASLVLLRLLPVVARLLERLTARGRRLGGALASWEISRRAVTQSGPVLLAVLAVATGTLTLAQYQSWRQSAHDQAAFAAGADVRVDTAGPLSLAEAGAVSHARGVTAAMPVSSQQAGPRGTLLAIDAGRAGATALLRPDLSPVPAARLWPRLAPTKPAGLALPGRPARLAVTARLQAGGPDGPRRLTTTMWVQGADGVAYELPAGALPADGRDHVLAVSISSSASYPLRLLGLSLSYSMPPPPGKQEKKAGVPLSTLTISRLALGSAGAQTTSGQALSGWQDTVSAPGLTSLGPLAHDLKPGVTSWKPAAGGAQALTFQAGYAPPATAQNPVGYAATLLLAARPPATVLAGVATRRFVTGNHLHQGSTVAVPVAGTIVDVRIAAVITAFPTAPGSALIVGQGPVQALLASQGAGPLPVTQWWLATRHGAVPPGLPAGSSVVVRSRLLATLLDNSLTAAPLLEGLAIAGAAALLAGLGFSAGVAASVRERRGQSALLAALGYPRLAEAAGLCLEELMLTAPAALAGFGVGVGLAHLIVPAITLTPDATAPVPAVLVQTPLAWAVLLALVVIVTPVAVAAVALVRRPDPAAELRAAEA
jgi:hypothetical protein